MKFVHKFDVDGQTFFTFSDKPSRPQGSARIQPRDWVGRTKGQEAASFLRGLKFESKEEKGDSPRESSSKLTVAGLVRNLSEVFSGKVNKDIDKEAVEKEALKKANKVFPGKASSKEAKDVIEKAVARAVAMAKDTEHAVKLVPHFIKKG